MSLFPLPGLRSIATAIQAFGGRLRGKAARRSRRASPRRLLVDSLEQRVLLSVVPNDLVDTVINQTVIPGATGDGTLAAKSLAADDDGDFVVTWVRNDPVIDPLTNLQMVDPQTGLPLTEANIYARYFTDEVQRLTLPSAIAVDNVAGVNGSFTLVYGGNVQQKLSITPTYEPFSFVQTNMAGQFVLAFDVNGNGTIGAGETTPPILYDETDSLDDLATQIETALRGIGGVLGEPHPLAVTPVSPHEFVIEFEPSYDQNGDLIQVQVESFTFTTGFLPAVTVETVREPIVLANIPVSATNAQDTANAIEQAFLRLAKNYPIGPVDFPPPDRVPSAVEGPQIAPPLLRTAVPQVSVVALSTTQFDITFTGVSGKKDQPLLAVTAAQDDFGNALLPSPQLSVRTLKEPSPEFRVNPEEPDDPFTPGPDVYDQTNPQVAMDADGDFVIVWQSVVPNSVVFGSFSDVFGRRFKPVGTVDPANVDFVPGVSLLRIPDSESAYRLDDFTFRVNETTTNPQFEPTVGMDEAGNFVVAWANGAQDFSFFNGIKAQRFNRHGERLGNEFLVNAEDTNIHIQPYVGMSYAGNFVIAWELTGDAGYLVGGGYATTIQVKAYGTQGQVLLPQFFDFGGGPPTVAFDMNQDFLVGTNIGNNDADGIGGGNSSGVVSRLYRLFNADGTVSGAVIRDTFRANSAATDNTGAPLWPMGQTGNQVGLDADGDVVIMYEGYGPDASETTLIPGRYFADLINLQENADLLPFFDPQAESLANALFLHGTLTGAYDGFETFSHYGANGDVDGVIEDVLINAAANGATDAQLGRLRALLDRIAGLLRGEANGIMTSRWDADPNLGALHTLFSDSIMNATRDGHNDRYILVMDSNVDWDNFVLQLGRLGVAGSEQVTVTAARPNNVFSQVGTRENIDNALENAARVGTAWPESAAAGTEGPIDVRIIDPFEVVARQGTPWELPGVDPNDYVFEITFQGSAHDWDFFLAGVRGFSTGNEVQIMSFAPTGAPPLQGTFHVQFTDSNGDLQQSAPITFNSNSLNAVAGAIQAALTGLGFDGVVVTSIAGGPPYDFQILFAGNSGNTDQPIIIGVSEVDPNTNQPLLAATISTATVSPGGATQIPPPDVFVHTNADTGLLQTAGGMRVQPDGSFVVAWTQFEETTDGLTSNATIRYHRMRELNDTAGPRMTDLVAPSGQQVDDGATVSTVAGLQYVVLDFNEQLLSFDDATLAWALQQRDQYLANGQAVPDNVKRILDSATNPENYRILLNGQPIGGAIARVQFGMNMAADLAAAYGLDPIPSNKWEAVITLDANSAEPGLQPLLDGTYTIEALTPVVGTPTVPEHSGLRDKAGNPLGYTGFQLNGQNFARTFRVLVGQPGPEPPGPPPEGATDAQVNTTTANYQLEPQAAMSAIGDYIAVWTSYGQGTDTGQQSNIIAQRFNRLGEPQGPEFTVNTFQAGSQLLPDVAMDTRGDFVVVWTGQGADDSQGVYARLFDRFGTPLSDQFRVNSFRVGTQTLPRVAMDADGDFVVAWSGYSQNDADGVYARRFNRFGNPRDTADVLLTTSPSVYQERPDVAMDDNGNFVAVWMSYGQDGQDFGVMGRVFNADGQPRGGEFVVNQYNLNAQRDPRVAMDADGDFVVAWSSYGQDGSGYGVYARRFSPSGAARAAEFRVNQTTFMNQDHPAVAMDDAGNFTVTWTTYGQDYDLLADKGVYARMFQADGSNYTLPPKGSVIGEFRVNAIVAGNQQDPAIGMDAVGNYVIAWVGPDASGTGIYSRILDPPLDSPNYPPSTTLNLTGTAGNDVFEFSASANPWLVKVNGAAQSVAPGVVTIRFDGLGGSDRVVMTGTGGVERAELYPTSIKLVLGTYTISATNVELITADAGAGADEMVLYDSPGDDHVTMAIGTTTLSGTGFSHIAKNFETVYAYASGGGYDDAVLLDSPGDDKFVANPQTAWLYGAGFSFRTKWFDMVNAYGSGGSDEARITGSAGDDTLVATPVYTKLFSTSFLLRAKNFDKTYSYSAGGNDTARFYDSAGDDTFNAVPDQAEMSGAGYYLFGSQFDAVTAYSTAGGVDQANLTGSSGTDAFYGYSTRATFYGPGFSTTASKFAKVVATAAGGDNDTAYLYDSLRDDTFTASPAEGTLLGPGYSNTAKGFDAVHGYATSGGFDQAFLYDSAGDDRFVGTSSYSKLYGTAFFLRAKAFDAVYGYASGGGNDTASFEGTAAADRVVADTDYVKMYGDSYLYRAKFFDDIQVKGLAAADLGTLYNASLVSGARTRGTGDVPTTARQVLWLLQMEQIQIRNTPEQGGNRTINATDQFFTAYW